MSRQSEHTETERKRERGSLRSGKSRFGAYEKWGSRLVCLFYMVARWQTKENFHTGRPRGNILCHKSKEAIIGAAPPPSYPARDAPWGERLTPCTVPRLRTYIFRCTGFFHHREEINFLRDRLGNWTGQRGVTLCKCHCTYPFVQPPGEQGISEIVREFWIPIRWGISVNKFFLVTLFIRIGTGLEFFVIRINQDGSPLPLSGAVAFLFSSRRAKLCDRIPWFGANYGFSDVFRGSTSFRIPDL